MTQISIKVFQQEIQFLAGAEKPNQLLKSFLPQVAFIGKSNVGKSTLVNAVCNRKSLSRVSNTPGRTQQINFFSVANKFLITDLPGYGFAKAHSSQRQKWEGVIPHYLYNEKKLTLVNLLIDARRGIKEKDVQVIELLKDSKQNFQIVLTKSDKVNCIEKSLVDVKRFLSLLGCFCNVISTSSKSAQGIKELRVMILDAIKQKT